MMQDWFIERFINSFTTPPDRITIDIDTMDDPTHGQQQLTFFHGYYKQYQYLVRYVTCAENDMVVLPQLLFGDAIAKLGAVDQLHTIIARFHQRFPETVIHIRADSAFGGLEEYDSKQWNGPKTVVVKTELTAFSSSSQRAVITNIRDAAKDPRVTYLDYAMRCVAKVKTATRN